MERLGDEVRRSLRGAGVPDAGVLAEVTRAWPDAVGPTIAAAAWPARTARDGTLLVSTISSVWAFELQRMEAEVAKQLAAALPNVELPRLKFAVGHVPAPPIATPGSDASSPPSRDPRAEREADALAHTVEDESLRELVRRAASASLARQPGDRGF